jgi:tetratricopeptide (TPR) repeat protein
MKHFLTYTLSLLITVAFFSCNKQKPVTNTKDYQQHLKPSSAKINFIDGEISFWTKRLQQSPQHTGALLKLASHFTNRFQYSGDIREIKKADSIYKEVNKFQKNFSSSVYRNLATNAITQHQFCQSKYYLDSAAAMGDNLAYTILQQADVQLELGNVYESKRLLKRYPQQNSFEVLIRSAKILDHEGKLDEAIVLMEKAYDKIKNDGNESAYTWIKSNLGDFYSHAGRYTQAYQSYLDVLKVDSENYHSLKGIAWLAFSHDRNTAAAKEILSFLKQQHPVPDYDLLLAEIAAYENNEPLSKEYISQFIKQASNPLYGDMYNTYLFNLYADEFNNTAKAMQIAQTELRNRPTPESYNLLSWAYFKSGNRKEALKIAKRNVEGKSFEPDVAYHLAMIYKANGEDKKARKYFKTVRSSLFELGPSFEKNINSNL